MHLSSLLLSFAVASSPLNQLQARVAQQTAGGAIPLALGPTCESRTPIRSLPYTITSSGSYYVAKALTGTSGSSGITIAATDVTIDLNGFSLSGVPGSLRGIVGAAGQNVTIFNGTVRAWGQEGIYLPAAAAVHVENLTAAANGATAGLVLGGSGTVKCVVADGNTGTGMIFGSATTQSHFVVTGSVASSNGADGFTATATGGFADSFAFDGCLARANGAEGFEVRDVGALRGCTAFGNGGDGFQLVNSTAENCAARQNGVDGYDLFGSIVSNCSATNNVEDGFDLVRVNQVLECTASGNGGNGILCTNERNLIDSNLLVLNVGFGVVSTDSRNTIIRNTAVDNTAGAYSASGARFGPVQSPSTATSPWANF